MASPFGLEIWGTDLRFNETVVKIEWSLFMFHMLLRFEMCVHGGKVGDV